IIESVPQRNLNTGDRLPADGIPAKDDFGIFALSSAQLGVWFAQRIDPSSAAYNIGECVEIRRPVEPTWFEPALRRLLAEPDSLRTHILEDGGVPRGKIGYVPAWSLPFVDLSAEIDAWGVAVAQMRSDLARPVDPTREPLFAFILFRASAERHFWYAR